jgi:hypothetical protein
LGPNRLHVPAFGITAELREADGLDHFFAMVEFVDINGARLAYTISDNDATKPILITLHGGRGFGKCR